MTDEKTGTSGTVRREGPGVGALHPAPGEEVYLPAEDTMALMRALRGYSGPSCLEIGFGSGVVLQSLAGRFETVVGTDVLTLGQARRAKSRGVELVLTDRARCFRDGVFDLVAFNPPYLPSEEPKDRTVDGGRGGIEVPLSFLREAMRVARPGGKVVFVMSDEADLEQFERDREAEGSPLVAKERSALFYESLVVYEAEKSCV